MSCHDIGRGMNSVVKVTIELYDAGKINRESTIKVIRACANGVNWCDGNRDEATDYIRRCRCGRCLKMVPEGEKLYSVWDVSHDVPRRYDIDDDFGLASDGLCEECFDLVLNQHCGDQSAGERERKYIEEQNDPRQYLSTGQHEDSNNGCRWV